VRVAEDNESALLNCACKTSIPILSPRFPGHWRQVRAPCCRGGRALSVSSRT